MLLVLGLGFILGYRTRTYMNQIVVETTDAVLKEGPGTEFPQKSFLKKEQRLTVYSRKNHWLHVKTDNGKTGWVADWMIADGYKNPIEKLGDATIVIDAGHGGADSGALSIKNKMEKKYTLLYAKELEQKLEGYGAKVYMTRSSDKTVSLSSRPILAHRFMPMLSSAFTLILAISRMPLRDLRHITITPANRLNSHAASTKASEPWDLKIAVLTREIFSLSVTTLSRPFCLKWATSTPKRISTTSPILHIAAKQWTTSSKA